MDRESLFYRSNKMSREKCQKDIAELRKKIKEKGEEIEQLMVDLKEKHSTRFYELYRESPENTMEKHVERMIKCCGQSGEGYTWWLAGDYWKNKPSYSHCVVLPEHYQKAQPTQQERDAYWTLTESEIRVTEKPHMEFWGN